MSEKCCVVRTAREQTTTEIIDADLIHRHAEECVGTFLYFFSKKAKRFCARCKLFLLFLSFVFFSVFAMLTMNAPLSEIKTSWKSIYAVHVSLRLPLVFYALAFDNRDVLKLHKRQISHHHNTRPSPPPPEEKIE